MERITNTDMETGIHYGVIPFHEVLQAWADNSTAEYPKDIECSECGQVVNAEEEICPKCGNQLINCFDNLEPLAFTYQKDGYTCIQENDDPDIFIIKSPHYTYCKFCSPCAPGAGYLLDYFEPKGKDKEQIQLLKIIAPLAVDEAIKSYAEAAGYIKAYCFDCSWFEVGKTPYHIYHV